MKREEVIGVDGCPGGWLAAVASPRPGHFKCFLYPSVQSLWSAHKNSAMILIDMPIGLAQSSNPLRECDKQARTILNKRRSSIFYPPIREVVDLQNYTHANQLSKDLTGKGLSIQSWNIRPKIIELDTFLCRNPVAADIFRESHPELCFTTLNDMNPLRYSKKEHLGINERLEILRRYYPGADSFLADCSQRFRRCEARLDDIIDALCLAVRAASGIPLKKIPPDLPHSSEDMPMVIWY